MKTEDASGIRCYDKVRLSHRATGRLLHSHDIKLKSGSGLQEVVCHKNREDNNWFVAVAREPSNRQPMYSFQNNDVILLVHMSTKRKLHSGVEFESAVSKMQEVCCCEDSACKQDGWQLQLGEQSWKKGAAFQLLHEKSKAHLHSHKKVTKLTGLQEVTCVFLDDSTKEGTEWQVLEVEPFIYAAPARPLARGRQADDQLLELRKRANSKKEGTTAKLQPIQKVERESDRRLMAQSRRVVKQRKQQAALESIVRRQQAGFLQKYCCCCLGGGSDYQPL